MDFARGYIASGEFNGNRTPQHIQNQIIKAYCDANTLKFVLSRAEYWINGSTDCQLWAALKEGFKHLVFYSIWQLPESSIARRKIYEYCIKKEITLHFATERMSLVAQQEIFSEFELLIKLNSSASNEFNCANHLQNIKEYMQ